MEIKRGGRTLMVNGLPEKSQGAVIRRRSLAVQVVYRGPRDVDKATAMDRCVMPLLASSDKLLAALIELRELANNPGECDALEVERIIKRADVAIAAAQPKP